jgi:hypothetical protein
VPRLDHWRAVVEGVADRLPELHDLTFITGSGFARARSCGLQVCGRRSVDLRTSRARGLVGWRTFAR